MPHNTTNKKTVKDKKIRNKEANSKKFLDSINNPSDLRKLSVENLPKVASEIRDYMIDVVSRKGGHLAPSLGATDLAIALHYVYNTPEDKIVWDVGHQAYAHKILTGRKDSFETLRQSGGISGFPRISESEYDTLSVGHASTSISAGLGMALARDIKKEKHKVVAVIGDGSLTAGLAFEGLNNLGASATDMTVIVNDNKMSISKNVGALSRYLTRVLTDKRFNKVKNDVWELFGQVPHVGERIRNLVHNIDDTLKHFVIPGKLFEDLGLSYFGPVDGHNISELIDVLKFVRDHNTKPAIIHVITKKGKGYRFAENDATKYHGVGTFSVPTGDVKKSSSTSISYSEVFGQALTDIGKLDNKVVAVTAAMPDGTALKKFRDEYPDRFFDVGIAEQHAITFAAGMALNGVKPVVALYSTFLQRTYDQIVHDLALDNLNVVVCVDRAGLVGEDGPTHHGVLDVSFLRSIPNVTVMAPANAIELRNMLYTALTTDMGPVFIRYPRGIASENKLNSDFDKIKLYEPQIIQEGKDCAIIAFGSYLKEANQTSELLKKDNINCTVINARFAKPLNETFYSNLFVNYKHIITLENNSTTGGFGSGILELNAQYNNKSNILCLGYPDEFIVHGSIDNLHESLELTPPLIAKKIKNFIKK